MTTGVDDIPDEILCNILSRLPIKLMVGRCRCVSRRWNALISDHSSFMMSRPPLIFLESCCRDEYYIHILDESRESDTNLDFSIFNLPPLRDNCGQRDRRSVTIVGTFSGIILLVVTYHTKHYPSYITDMKPHMILYNPATGVYDILDDGPFLPFYCNGDDHAYGFGYGATTPDELKIVRVRKHHSNTWNTCDVFNLKTRSWSKLSKVLIKQDAIFEDLIGTFLEGYLYWIINKGKKGNRDSKIVVFDVDTMVFSEINLPDPAINDKYNRLGTCHGSLWMISNTAVKTLNFDVWVMNINDQGVDNYLWSKKCSLTIGLEAQHPLYSYKIIEITDDGRIMIYVSMEDFPDTIIYDTSKHSYKLQDISLECPPNRGIEYKESLVSPMNICRTRLT